jgi:hypothetical protein
MDEREQLFPTVEEEHGRLKEYIKKDRAEVLNLE